jgi:uncharacterized coiled-coil DUF342 family protein
MINEKADELKSDYTGKLKEKIDNGKFNNLLKKVKTNEETIEEILQKISSLSRGSGGDTKQLIQRIEAVEKDIEHLNGDVKDLKGVYKDIEGLKSEIDRLRKMFDEFENELNNLKQDSASKNIILQIT